MAVTRPPPTSEQERIRGDACRGRLILMSSAPVYLGICVSLYLVYQNRRRTTCPVRRSMVLTTSEKRRCCRVRTGLPTYDVLLHYVYERFTAVVGDHAHHVILAGFDFEGTMMCRKWSGSGEKILRIRNEVRFSVFESRFRVFD